MEHRRTTALLVVVALVALAVSSAASAQDPEKLTADQVMQKMQEFYRNTYDYQARFEQIYTDMAAGEDKKSHGRVFLKKPGKMRWDYLKKSDPKVALNKVMVSNGKAFTVYEPELNQYFRQCLSDSQLPTALSFLMGKGEMEKEFTPKLVDAKKADAYAIEMTPKKSSGQYKKLVFVVDRGSFAVQEAHIYDPYGNRNKLLFQSPLINKKLPDSGFDFQPPKDARNIGPSNLKCK